MKEESSEKLKQAYRLGMICSKFYKLINDEALKPYDCLYALAKILSLVPEEHKEELVKEFKEMLDANYATQEIMQNMTPDQIQKFYDDFKKFYEE